MSPDGSKALNFPNTTQAPFATINSQKVPGKDSVMKILFSSGALEVVGSLLDLGFHIGGICLVVTSNNQLYKLGITVYQGIMADENEENKVQMNSTPKGMVSYILSVSTLFGSFCFCPHVFWAGQLLFMLSKLGVFEVLYQNADTTYQKPLEETTEWSLNDTYFNFDPLAVPKVDD